MAVSSPCRLISRFDKASIPVVGGITGGDMAGADVGIGEVAVGVNSDSVVARVLERVGGATLSSHCVVPLTTE